MELIKHQEITSIVENGKMVSDRSDLFCPFFQLRRNNINDVHKIMFIYIRLIITL